MADGLQAMSRQVVPATEKQTTFGVSERTKNKDAAHFAEM